MASNIRVTVWNEYYDEKVLDESRKLYPDGMHRVLADHIEKQDGMSARTATLEEPAHGLTPDVLDQTDVLIWWAHRKHDQVDDAIAAEVKKRVLEGMGFIALHSAHFSKPFTWLMGTSGSLCWRDDGEREVLWVCSPAHPIVQGVGPCIILEKAEMYGEPFDVPQPDQQIFISSFEGGEVFRSGGVWFRGAGTVFYFRPGHETYPLFYNEQIMRVITNAVRFVAPSAERLKVGPVHRPMGWFEKSD